MAGLGAIAGSNAATTWVVNSATDTHVAGQVTLREAIAAAGAGDSIEFAAALFSGSSPTVIKLTSPLSVSKNLTVVGPGDVPGATYPRLTLEGNGSDRILQIQSGTVVIAGIKFFGGKGVGGGAVLVESGANVLLQGCDFVDNQVTGPNDGGAILNRGTLTLDQCLVRNNRATNGGGVASEGVLTVVRSLIDLNTASTGFGGGIQCKSAALSIESSTISRNTAGTGGGIAFLASGKTAVQASITAATVVDNKSGAQTGGLYVEGAGAVASVGGSLFARNFVVNNSGAQTPHDLGTQKSGKINSLDYNLVVKPGTTFSPYGPHDQIGIDPRLGDLANNGGRTATYAIGIDSPAYNRGNPDFVGVLALTDQRGSRRVWPSPGRADVGAFEFAVTLTSPETLTVEATGAKTPVTVTATLALPRGGTALVTWKVGGVSGTTSTVVIPENATTKELTYSGEFALGTTAVSVEVTTGTWNLSCSTTVNVVDTTPPTITLLGNSPLFVEQGGTYNDPGATAVDLVDGACAVAVDATAVVMSTTGTYTVFYTASDKKPNVATVSREVYVRDTTPPKITVPADIVAEAKSAAGAVVAFTVTAADTASIPTVTSVPASGTTFALGVTTVIVTATDVAGNQSTASFKVTVVDTTPPAIQIPANIVAEATSAAGAVVTFSAPATDAVSSAPTITSSPASGSVFPLGTTSVTITAKDSANNVSTASFTVTVRDTTAPQITLPGDLTVMATMSGGAPVTFNATATDAVSTPFVTAVPASGSVFPKGTTKVTVTATDIAGNVATGTFTVTVNDPYGVTLNNVVWPKAIPLDLETLSPGRLGGAFRQMIARAGESRWYKFIGRPGSRIDVTLTHLPANFDVVVYSDIRQVYNDLLALLATGSTDAQKKLALLGAQFSPEAYSPEAYSPEAYSPEAYSPEAYSPEAYSPEAYSPEAYSPEAYSPEAYSPEAYSPEAYSPEAYSPEAYSPEAYSPEAYASAQQRSLIGFSAAAGTASEGIRFNTYSKSGEFYIRVRGQSGIYSLDAPYDLTVTSQQDLCSGVTNMNTTPSPGGVVVTGSPSSLIVWDRARMGGSFTEKEALKKSLDDFAAAVNGVVVDVSLNSQISILNDQAAQNPKCPIAKNLVAEAIRNLIQAYRSAAPSIADITLIGNDDVIPFFRSDDRALLASESAYFPPVKDGTQSQSSLRYAQVLSQDRYGSSSQVVLATGPYDLPEIPVGRLVETATEVKTYVDAYRALFNSTATSGTVPTLSSAFVAGYDFLADSAEAMKAEFAAGLGAGATLHSLISPQNLPPAFGWTASQLRTAFLGSRHDLAYLAGHFSTAGALAADYTTRFRASELAASSVDLTYALILSAGCHSGYNTVDWDAILQLTEQPDWAQAFARKRAMWIAGTGYQYGDTDFIEYTERLLLEFARALRTGTGPIAVGRALVDAKRRYLANTPVMRGIHEKTLLQVTLYGLPMVKLNLPGPRLTPPATTSDMAGIVPVTSRLFRGELTVDPVLTRVDRTLDVIGSTPSTVIASYFTGSDGFVSIPGEPVRPRESFNVSRSEGLVRGVGLRSAAYTDLGGFRPFTGAPATETRGVHGSFSTEVFYPVQPWNLNHIGGLSSANGAAEFNVFPTQFLSDSPDSALGTLRKYSKMQFTLYYSPELSNEALANPPAINVVASRVSETGLVTFSVDAAATAGAGVQEVWVTYTGLPGSPYYGSWQSVTLSGPAAPGIGTWTGALPETVAKPQLVRFIVQAVNGFGAVTQSTNFGRYYMLGTSTLDGVGVVGKSTIVKLLEPPTTGEYRALVSIKASLAEVSGAAIAGRRVQFRIGPVVKTALTDVNGVAAATLVLAAPPGTYALEASFAGDATYQNSSAQGAFEVQKMPTALTFDTASFVPDSANIIVNLHAKDGTPLKERTVVFLITNGSYTTATAEITDGAGQARVTNAVLASATYTVSAYFGQPVTIPDGTPNGSQVPLDDPLYAGCSASRTVTVATTVAFGNEQAWTNYADATAPGATPVNLGLSKAEIAGSITGSSPTFGPGAIMASAKSANVSAYLQTKLSGRTIADGPITLKVQANDNLHWRGSARLSGVSVELNVDWDGSGGTGRYHVWIYPPVGSGPLYNDAPALLKFELILGTGAGEHPTGGTSEIGTPDKPWTQQTGNSRVRSN